MTRVLGIDPGLGRTGAALVEGVPSSLRLISATRLDTIPQTSEAARLCNLFDLVVDVVNQWRPDVASIELLFVSTNKRTAMRVSEARGVILCALGRNRIPVHEYTPTQVKEAVCGYGGARKPQVVRMTSSILGLEPASDDVADACAVAICHHHRSALQSSTRNLPSQPLSDRLQVAVARARAVTRAVL
jgi:crossover junction endodeoxyribonuclease RuvC